MILPFSLKLIFKSAITKPLSIILSRSVNSGLFFIARTKEIKSLILINFVEINKLDDEIFLSITLDNESCVLTDSSSIKLFLYKIFGPRAREYTDKVKGGINKDELLAKYNHVLGLDDINLDIKEQSIQVVMGLSGSGKSTLIRHINRLIEPTEGTVLVDGEDITKLNKADLLEFRRNKTGMVFQRFALFPHHAK